MKIIWINGCFDVMHRGHIELFKYAKSVGDFVVVGIDSDNRVRSLKGEARPINKEEDRKFLLESIRYIDKVVVFDDEKELRMLISLHKPDAMVIGSDYKNKKIIGKENAKKVIFFDRIDGYSTTKTINNFNGEV